MMGCRAVSQEDNFLQEKKLDKELKEISGMAHDGDVIWAISDNPKRGLYKLDLEGNVLASYSIQGYQPRDVECVSVDDQYVYMGDTGDNNGTRGERAILRIAKNTIPDKGSVKGELIRFNFAGAEDVSKKKENAYDCEAMFVYQGTIYLFTKRRTDEQTEFCTIPAKPGTYTTQNHGLFNSKGLVTDACINDNGTEVALTGYDKGHRKPFIWIFSNFKGTDFLHGNSSHYDLSNKKKLDWQVESVTYRNHNNLFIACEGTKDVPQTFYELKLTRLAKN